MDKCLKDWCHRQRALYRNGLLSIDKIRMLNSIDTWFWGIDDFWNNKAESLKKYCEANPFPPESNTHFGTWIGSQRQKYKDDKLSHKQITILESINGWFWEYNDIWTTMFDKVYDYINIQDNPIPTAKQKPFGGWIAEQRYAYSINNKRMDNYRISKLETINGWFWNKDDLWEQRFNDLYNHTNIHNNELLKYSDSSWIYNQRTYYKNNKLSEYRIHKLNSINGWYWERDDNYIWDIRFEELNSFLQENKSYPKKDKHMLGRWIDKQRADYKLGKLNQYRISTLESLPNWKWGKTLTNPRRSWDENFEILFKIVNIDGNPIPNRKSDSDIGGWVDRNRTKKLHNKLTNDQIDKLESINGWWWNAWDHKISLTHNYILEHGHLPPAKEALGGWLNNQRQQYKKNRLSKYQCSELESIKGWWWESKSPDEVFIDKVNNLNDYIKHHNKFPPYSISLGVWVCRQRSNYRTKKLSQDRIDLLESIPNWEWSSK